MTVESPEMTLDQRIEALQSEIDSITVLIENLKGELERLRRVSIQPKDNSPSAKAEAAIASAKEVSKRRPQIDGTISAIESLTNELVGKERQLSQLQAYRAKEFQALRMEEAHAAIAAHVERFEAARANLEAEMWALKQTWDEHHQAFIEGQTDPNAGTFMGHGHRWQPKPLVSFEFLILPELAANPNKTFSLKARNIDIFKAEKQRLRQTELENQARHRKAIEEVRAQSLKSSLETNLRRLELERDRLTGVLANKENRAAECSEIVQKSQQLRASGHRFTPAESRELQELNVTIARLKNELTQTEQEIESVQQQQLELEVRLAS